MFGLANGGPKETFEDCSKWISFRSINNCNKMWLCRYFRHNSYMFYICALFLSLFTQFLAQFSVEITKANIVSSTVATLSISTSHRAYFGERDS